MSKLRAVLKGVKFALSGYVNPERKELRELAEEMGATYSPNWSKNCTHLACAFGGTPKIMEAEKDGGIIVKGDWIRACWQQESKLDESDA